MMQKPRSRPNWLVLFLVITPVLGVLWLEAREPLSQVDHKIVEIGLVVLLYGIVAVWLKANEHIVMFDEHQKRQRQDQHLPTRSRIVYGERKDSPEGERR